MSYNPMFEGPSDSEAENAATTLQIIEDTARLAGLIAKAVMETTKDEDLAERWIVEAVTKAEKNAATLGFENTADLKDAISEIRCLLMEWDADDDTVVEQAISEHFLAAFKAASRVEDDAPSYDEEMRREHGTYY